MIEKFKKASNDRLINYIDLAIKILTSRGYKLTFKLHDVCKH